MIVNNNFYQPFEGTHTAYFSQETIFVYDSREKDYILDTFGEIEVSTSFLRTLEGKLRVCPNKAVADMARYRKVIREAYLNNG